MNDIGLIAALAKALGGGGGSSPSGGSSLIVIATYDDGVTTFDKTWKECYDAMAAGGFIVVKYDNELTPMPMSTVAAVYYTESEGYCVVVNGETTTFQADTENDYPSQSAY